MDVKDYWCEVQGFCDNYEIDIATLEKKLGDTHVFDYINENHCTGFSAEFTAEELVRKYKESK